MIRGLLVAGLCILALVLAGEPARVQILHAPRYLTDDTPVSFDVRVLPDAANRLLVMAALDDTGEAIRRSDEELDGATAQVTRRLEWNSLRAGSYTLLARTFDGAGRQLAQATAALEVLEWRR